MVQAKRNSFVNNYAYTTMPNYMKDTTNAIDKQTTKRTITLPTYVPRIALALLVVVIAIVVANQLDSKKNGLKTITYDNGKKHSYQVDFYKTYTTKTLQTGTKQLVSTVARDGKYPLVFSVANGDTKAYDQLKKCTGYTKVMTVKNKFVNEDISVCDYVNKQSQQQTKDVVYVAGFTSKNTLSVVTISQDFTKGNFSTQAAAKESLKNVGLVSYRDDIKTILSSIQPK